MGSKIEGKSLLLTVLISLISWLLIHIIDELVNSPIVKYSTSSKKAGDTLFTKYTFENISNDKNFSISLQFLDSSKRNSNNIINLWSKFLPPMKLSSDEDSIHSSKKNWVLNITEFQPGCEFTIDIAAIAALEIPVRISSKSAIKLMKSGVLTFIIENELVIAAFLTIFGAIFLIYIPNKSNNDRTLG